MLFSPAQIAAPLARPQARLFLSHIRPQVARSISECEPVGEAERVRVLILGTALGLAQRGLVVGSFRRGSGEADAGDFVGMTARDPVTAAYAVARLAVKAHGRRQRPAREPSPWARVELALLLTLAFDFDVPLPYEPLLALLRADQPQAASRDGACAGASRETKQLALTLLNDSFDTPLVLLYAPDAIARGVWVLASGKEDGDPVAAYLHLHVRALI
jgi:hypothetical protein